MKQRSIITRASLLFDSLSRVWIIIGHGSSPEPFGYLSFHTVLNIIGYALFGRWTEQSVFFVTRMKSNAQYEVIHTIPGGESGVQREEWIRLTGTAAACPGRLRRITVWDEKQQMEIKVKTLTSQQN